jgi:exodeoxyribonuclease VII large subunit
VHPAQRLRAHQQAVTQLSARLGFAFLHAIRACDAKLARLDAALRGMDPQAVLARGYSITYGAGGEVLRDAAQVRPGDRLRTALARGEVHSEVRNGKPS